MLPARKHPLTTFYTLSPFLCLAELFLYHHFFPRFVDVWRSQLKFLKVGWWISVCLELSAERLNGIKPTLGCGGKAEG